MLAVIAEYRDESYHRKMSICCVLQYSLDEIVGRSEESK